METEEDGHWSRMKIGQDGLGSRRGMQIKDERSLRMRKDNGHRKKAT